MLHTILIAGALVAITVAIHAVGLGIVLSRWARLHPLCPTRFWPITWLLIRLAWFLILIHLVEISVWGIFYFWRECLPDAESAFYFAGVTYTTIGYGDLVLKEPWRMLGPVEGLSGILMCGLSAGIFFAVVAKIYLSPADRERK
jgi:hypothetical protein